MPVRRKVDRRRSEVPPWDIELDLSIGWISDRDEDEMRDAWERYRDHLLTVSAVHHPGMRPYAWWVFDRDRDPPASVHEEADILFGEGELDRAEIDQLRRIWRGGDGPRFLKR